MIIPIIVGSNYAHTYNYHKDENNFYLILKRYSTELGNIIYNNLNIIEKNNYLKFKLLKFISDFYFYNQKTE